MYKIIKRLGDIFLAAICLLLLLPFLLPVAVILKVTGEGEVFYRQERMGYKNKTFGILKFATMLKDSLTLGNKTVTLRNDPRITPFGKVLRMTKMNELPQIWNVLVGDMSIVGPRPLLVPSFKKYEEEIQEIIYKNRPGITGLGSIVFRDEEKLTSLVRKLGGEPLGYYRFYIYPYKGKLEKYYFSNISFITDIKIIILTAWQLVFKKSDLVYRLFPDLPEKPRSLTIEGIKEMDVPSIKEIVPK